MRALAAGLFLAAALLGAAATEAPLAPAAERLQQEALEYVQAQAAGLPGAYTFKVVKPPVLPRVPGELRFRPDHLSKGDPGGRFFVSFTASVDGRPLGMVRVDMEGTWTGKLLRTRTALPRKTVPEPTQLEEIDFNGAPPAGAVTAVPDGFRLRNALPPGHLLVRADLEAIPVILAGDRVRLAVVSGDLTVAVETFARSSGAVGDSIRLELPNGRKPLQAVVIGPGEAQTQWAGAK